MNKIVLYHGTNAKFLENIRRDGLLPRNKTGKNSNYTGGVVSKPGFVYLTSRYPVFYGYNACQDGDFMALFEVEVNSNALFPDEDFLAQVLHDKKGNRLPDIQSINPADWQKLYKASLDSMGNVCTQSVLPEQILRHVIIPTENFWILNSLGVDFNTYTLLFSDSAFEHISPIRSNLRLLFDKGYADYKKIYNVQNRNKINSLTTEEQNLFRSGL